MYVLERTQPVKEHEPLSYTRSVTETPQLQAAWEHHEENGVEQLIQVFVNELYHDTERDTTYTPPTCLECDMDTIVLALGGKDCLSCNYFTD